MRFFDNGEYAKSESVAAEILKFFPGDTVAMSLIGACRIKSRRYGEAIATFSDYIKRHPLDAMAHFYLGLAYHLAGNREKAISEYWAARLIDPELEAARANLTQLEDSH